MKQANLQLLAALGCNLLMLFLLFSWNEYLLAVTLTDSTESQTLTVGLAAFFGQYIRNWNSIMALSTLTSIPLMIIFVLFQRWVVRGMTSGAVK